MEVVAHQRPRRTAAAQREALNRALASGAERIELDVVASGGRLVLAHDLRAARRADPLDLADTLTMLEPTGLALLLDIKGPGTARPLGELLAASDWPSRTLLSGDLGVVELAASMCGAKRAWSLPAGRGAVPPAHAGPLGASTRAARARVRHAAAWAVAEGRADAVCVDRRFVTAALTAAVHAAGGRVLAWTVDRPAQASRLAKQNVDGLITNRPVEIAGALLSR